MKTECGKVIAANRKRLGLTQTELGAMLNVTAQAVSKWENGNAEPDFATLQRLTEIFGISAEEFFGNKTSSEETSSQRETPAPAEPQLPRIVIGYCEACGKPIEQNGPYHVYPATRGRAQRIVCGTCFEREEAERKRREYEQERKTFRRSMIVSSLIAALVLIVGVAQAVAEQDPFYLVYIAIAAALFMFVSQCFWTSYALDLLLFFCRSFRLPGLIFSLDLDGIIWFITVKLLFGILTALLSVLFFIVGLFVSMSVGVVTFPFCLTSEIRKLRKMRASIS